MIMRIQLYKFRDKERPWFPLTGAEYYIQQVTILGSQISIAEYGASYDDKIWIKDVKTFNKTLGFSRWVNIKNEDIK